jgi:hypothetical protein
VPLRDHSEHRTEDAAADNRLVPIVDDSSPKQDEKRQQKAYNEHNEHSNTLPDAVVADGAVAARSARHSS